MGQISKMHAPKVLVGFIVGQITGFVYSKEFKKRTMEFLSGAVDDVVMMVYKDAQNNNK